MQLTTDLYRLFLLPTIFTFCSLISPFLSSIATAMQQKNGIIRAQKPKISVPNKMSK